MAGAYTRGLLNIMNGTIDLDTSPLKFMLVNQNYTYDSAHPFVNSGSSGANLLTNELNVTNYAGGFNGAGRKITPVTLTEQAGNKRVVAIFVNPTWLTLGGVANGTVQAGVLIREITDDTASIPIGFFDFVVGLVPTNGSDFTINFDQVNGNLRWSV